MRAPDKTNSHYESLIIQPIEYILANELDFCSGNIIKYASRWQRKGDPEGDLLKIIDYANILLRQHRDEVVSAREAVAMSMVS
jgi:hypothetical protein